MTVAIYTDVIIREGGWPTTPRRLGSIA